MAAVIENPYVPPGTGRPGVLTNVQQPEAPPDLDRRTSGFLPYSSLYPPFDFQQGASPGQRCRRGLFKWSVVGALITLVGVVGVLAFLLISQSKCSASVFYPSSSTSGSPTGSKTSSATTSTKETSTYRSSEVVKTTLTGVSTNSGANLMDLTKKNTFRHPRNRC